jgi:hypothetical protein
MVKKIALVLLLSFLFFSCQMKSVRKWALVYGVGDYPGTTDDLPLARTDAESMTALLMEEGYTVYHRYDIDASVSNLNADFASLAVQMGPDDLFVFYYSGHGAKSVLPGETGSVNDESENLVIYNGALTVAGVSDKNLNSLLLTLPNNKKVVLLDSCFSGGFVAASGNDIDLTPDPFVGGPKSTILDSVGLYFNGEESDAGIPPSTALVLSAAGETELSFDSSSVNHGFFTYYLLKSREYADYDLDGYVCLSEIRAFTAYNFQVSIDPALINQGYDPYRPRLSGGPVDFVLFKKR